MGVSGISRASSRSSSVMPPSESAWTSYIGRSPYRDSKSFSSSSRCSPSATISSGSLESCSLSGCLFSSCPRELGVGRCRAAAGDLWGCASSRSFGDRLSFIPALASFRILSDTNSPDLSISAACFLSLLHQCCQNVFLFQCCHCGRLFMISGQVRLCRILDSIMYWSSSGVNTCFACLFSGPWGPLGCASSIC
jgi:hypothetical protein